MILPSDMDPDPVGSAFIWVRGSGSGSRGIKLREKQSLTKKVSYFFRFRFEQYNFLQKKPPQKVCLLNSSFPLILYPWIRIRIHGPK